MKSQQKFDWRHILKKGNDQIWKLHNRHVYHSIKVQNSNLRQHGALRAHLGLRLTGEGPLNLQVPSLSNHSWISSSQSFQKETRRTYQMLMLRFTFVSTDSGSRLRGTNSNAGNSLGFAPLVNSCARSNTDQHASCAQSNNRGNVTAEKSISPNHIIGQDSNLLLSVSVCIQLCQVLSVFFRAGWRGKDVGKHHLSERSPNCN